MAADASAHPSATSTVARTDSATDAFAKLDAQNHGYVTRAQNAQLAGFDDEFARFDRNGDGRLDRAEFAAAWNYYAQNAAAADVDSTLSGNPVSSGNAANRAMTPQKPR